MYSNSISKKRKFSEIPEGELIPDISRCNSISQIIYRISIDGKSTFSKDELLDIIKIIKKLQPNPPPIEGFSYIN